MKNVKKKYQKLVIALIVILTLYIGSIVAIFLLKDSLDGRLFWMLIVSFIFLVILLLFKPPMVYYTEMIKYVRLKENSSAPFKIKQSPFSSSLVNFLEQESFNRSNDYGDFIVFYKTLKENDYKIAKRGLLQAFIFIKNKSFKYNNPKIALAINEIEDNVDKKERFANYSIVLFKETTEFNEANIEETSIQVRFDKDGRNNVTVIPTLYNSKTNQIFYLNSMKHAPSSYYKFTLQLIDTYLKK